VGGGSSQGGERAGDGSRQPRVAGLLRRPALPVKRETREMEREREKEREETDM